MKREPSGQSRQRSPTLLTFLLVIFHWSLSDSKSPQISMTHLSILANLNTAVVLLDTIPALISNPFCLFLSNMWTVPSSLITISITDTFMFHRFFGCPAKIKVFVYRFAFFFTYCVVCLNSKTGRLSLIIKPLKPQNWSSFTCYCLTLCKLFFLFKPCPGYLACNLPRLSLEVSMQLFFFPSYFLDVVLLFFFMLTLLLWAAVISLSSFF